MAEQAGAGTGAGIGTQGLFLAAAVIVIVLMLILPMPAPLLDTLMALNLLLSILVLLITLNTPRVIDFSQFPTVLLILTIFGLGLNVSSTRLILTQGTRFSGRMVRAFSTFVTGGAGGNQGLLIGFVLFIIITAVQAFVIARGAKRTAEVNARYMLDSMTPRQMSLESEYNAGSLTDTEFRQRKADLQREIDISRAMDGASNFVSNNVKIGIFITFVNFIVGIIMGMALRREPFGIAIQTYAGFTIGDGLLSQIPSLFLSVATGLLVSRSASAETLEKDIIKEFTQSASAFYVGGATIAALGLFGLFSRSFPWYIMVPLGAAMLYAARRLQTRRQTAAFPDKLAEEKKKKEGASEDVTVKPLDPLSLELGYALIPLVDAARGAELLERVSRIRREVATDLGIVMPKVRITDNMRLDPVEYCIKIKGVETGRGKIRMGCLLCINAGGVREEIPGERTTEPTFGLQALWVTEDMREKAERAGYSVVDPPTIIATHLTHLIKTHAAEILGRQDTQKIIDSVKADYPAVVEGVISAGNESFTVGEIQKVLQGLLREQVSVRNVVVILETLADYAKVTHNTAVLIEKTRQALGRQICLQYADDSRCLHVVTIDAAFLQKLAASRVDTLDGPRAALDPASLRAWQAALNDTFAQVQDRGFQPVIFCPEESRRLVRSLVERDMPNLVVISIPEVPADIKIEKLGEIRVGT